LLTYPEVNLSL